MKVLLFLGILWLSTNLFSQSIWTNPITGTNPNTSNPYTTGQTVDANISVSGIGRGAGAVGTDANNRYNANSWNTATIDMTAYFEWTITPNVGCEIDFTNFVYTSQISNTSIANFAFRSSIDAFGADIGAPDFDGTTINLTAGTYQNISSAITFRFYTWGAGSSGNTFSINDFTFNGSTSCAPTSNTITTGAITGAPFSVDCSTPDLGSIDFTSTGTFNAGNTFTAQLSNASGSFASPVNLATSVSASGVDPSGTINFTIPAGTATGTGYRIRIISSNPSVTSLDNGSNISITNSPCTITTGAVSGGPFSVTCLTGMDGTVSFTSLGSFSAGNEFIAQLSNSSGSFAAPINIGSQDSTLSVGSNPSGTINFSIPAELPSGNYLIRVVSTNPVVIGSNSASFNITLTGGPCTLTPPYFSSAIINSCNPTCPEGHNELVFGNTGDYSVLVNTTNFNMSYGTTLPLTEYTDVLVSNAATTAAINAAAGCPGTFLNGTGVTLPAGASFILAPTQLCIDALSWSGLCGSGPIYMIYQDDLNWNLNGTFKNGNTGGTRYFNSTIRTTTAETFSINYNYNSTLLQNGLNGDGDYVSWGPNGGTATYGDNNCILTPVLLPTTTVNFKAFNEQGKNLLFWQTQSEQNNDYFTLQHSTDGVNYAEIGRLQGTGNSNALINYSFTHNRPPRGINYYKLTSTDYDGTNYIKGIASVMVEGEGTYFDPLTSQLKFGEKSDYSIYSTDGKLLGTENNTDSMEFQHHGMILIQDLRTLSIERLFIP